MTIILPDPLPPRSRPITQRSVLAALTLGARPDAAALAHALTLAAHPRHVRRAAACTLALARRGKIPEELTCN